MTHHPERRRAVRRMRNFTVTVMPEQRTAEVRPGAVLLDAAGELGLARTSPCGTGSCGMDPVFVVAGMENLSAPGDAERATLERLGLDGAARLACSARVQGDVAISLQAPAQDAPASQPAESAFAWQPEQTASRRA
jgi:nitrite reductase (NADH) large subunit